MVLVIAQTIAWIVVENQLATRLTPCSGGGSTYDACIAVNNFIISNTHTEGVIIALLVWIVIIIIHITVVAIVRRRARTNS